MKSLGEGATKLVAPGAIMTFCLSISLSGEPLKAIQLSDPTEAEERGHFKLSMFKDIDVNGMVYVEPTSMSIQPSCG
jgi:hypothetical protein